MRDLLDFTATCAFGLEAVLTRELRQLELANVQSQNGHVSFRGDLSALIRANLWARTADRIWLRLGQFPAHTFDQLFEGTRALPWPELLPREARFPVEGLSHHSQLSSVPACQSIVKKAVVESLAGRYGQQQFPESGPSFPIRVSLQKDLATLSLDTSGVGLHKRGYRLLTTQAPLRETLAAGMVLLSYWNADRLLLDPFCGSGTLLFEAALIGLNLAPGLERTFAAESWPSIPSKLWQELREEARSQADSTRKLSLLGYDQDPQATRLARQNLERLGLSDRGIQFETRSLDQLRTRARYGVIITNPPYGERLSELNEVEKLYALLGQRLAPLMDTWSVYVITNHKDFSRHFGRKEERRRKLYNGLIECTYYQFPGPRPPCHSTP